MAALPISDEVVHFLEQLTQSCTSKEIRQAVQRSPDVQRFFQAAAPEPAQPSDAESGGSHAASPAQGVVAFCELSDEVTGRPEVVATADPAALFQRLGPELGARREVPGRLKLPVSCTLVTRRPAAPGGPSAQRSSTPLKAKDGSGVKSGASASPPARQLGVRDLYIQSMDLSRPLDALQQWLQDVYEPMLRARKHQLSLRSSVQDLLTGIRSVNSALPEVNLLRYVPEDIVELCAAYPNLEVPQLVDRLGDTARDPSYLRRVLQVRNRCNSVLPLGDLLSGKVEMRDQQSPATVAAATGDGVGSASRKDGGSVAVSSTDGCEVLVLVVQERIAYWESASLWIEDVMRQLQTREWRLVHRLLGHRVETSYAAEYVTYLQSVREYIKYLQGIPEKQLVALAEAASALSSASPGSAGGVGAQSPTTARASGLSSPAMGRAGSVGSPGSSSGSSIDVTARFLRLAEDIFAAVMRPSSYPMPLVLALLEGIGNELAAVWTRVAVEKHIVETPEQARARGEAAPASPAASLRALREVATALESVQVRYVQCVVTLRSNGTLSLTAAASAAPTSSTSPTAAPGATALESSLSRRSSSSSAALNTLAIRQASLAVVASSAVGRAGGSLLGKSSAASGETVSSMTAAARAAQHPRLSALLQRCVVVRDWTERHSMLVEQLHCVFATKLRLAGQAPSSPSPQQQRSSAASSYGGHTVDRLPGEEFVEELQQAHHACVELLCNSNDLLSFGPVRQLHYEKDGKTASGLVTQKPSAVTTATSAAPWLLWHTTPAAQRRVTDAMEAYQASVDRCDEQVAQLVNRLLSAEQSTSLIPAASLVQSGSSQQEQLQQSLRAGGSSGSSSSADTTFGLRMFRIFANFRFLQLPKVQRVVANYEGPLAEKIAAEVKFLQEEYFSVSTAKRQTRFGVARYHLSSPMAQIARERKLQEMLWQCIVRYDYVAKNGWHQLLSLRNIEHYWRLDERLANFFGYPLEDLVTPELTAGSVPCGCAYGLAYLSLLYAEDAQEWSADPSLREAQDVVQTENPGLLQAAKDRLLAVGAGTVRGGRRAELREVRSTSTSMSKRLEEKTMAWCEDARKAISSLPAVDPNSLVLRGPIFRVVEVGPIGPAGQLVVTASTLSSPSGVTNVASSSSFPRASTIRGASPVPVTAAAAAAAAATSPSAIANGRNAMAPATAMALQQQQQQQTFLAIEVTFPWSVLTLAQDLRYAESSLLLREPAAAQSAAMIREFVSVNEHRGRLAECLREIIRVYYATVNGEDETLVLLATEEYRRVNECLMHGFTLRWMDDAALAQFALQVAERMFEFTKTVQQVRESTEAVYNKIKAFHVRAFHPEAVVQRVKEIRSIVTNLSLRCVNAHLWVRRTQPLLDAALREQMKYLLHGWTLDFLTMRTDVRYLDRGSETEVFQLRPLRVHMRVIYKEVRLESPAAAWRSHWIGQLNRYLQWIDVLPRLYNEKDIRRTNGGAGIGDGPSRSQTSLIAPNASGALSVTNTSLASTVHPADIINDFIDVANSGNLLVSSSDATGGDDGSGGSNSPTGGARSGEGYQYLLERLPPSALVEPLEAIEQCIQDAIEEEKEWRQSQEFLNLDVAVMQQRFGNDLKRWSDALQLMQRVTTQLMDYTQPNKLLGGIVIVAEDAQLELGRKMDQVSLYTHNKFKDVLEKELESTYQLINDDKAKTEALDVINDMKDAASFLSEVPRLKKGMDELEARVGLMGDAETSLHKLGYVFPEHWINAAKVKDEFNALKDLVDRRMKALQFRRPFLVQTAQDAAASIDSKVAKIEEQLAALDVQIAKTTPSAAQDMVDELYDEAVELKEEVKRVAAIQESLGAAPISAANVGKVLADTEHLKEVWGHVTKAFARLNQLGATPFFELVPRRLQEDLQNLQNEMDAYPEVVRSYQLCKELAEQLQKVMGYRRLVQDLRSDAMSPLERAQRHWIALRQQLQVSWTLENLTLQNIWDSDPTANAAIYNDVLEMAQGERRIEVQLQQISAFWEAFEFSLTVYRKQVALVRGWDAVFERLTDDLATFNGIRASPYFVSQQVVAMTNESEVRLNRLRQVLEVLLEVQKRWVYLDGVFTDNSEIRSQLPHDTVQFDRTSRELMHVFPRPRANGALPEVRAQFFLEDEKLLPTLERLHGQLQAVQRALTVYLDTQRSYFPRFFFVGDDDLLEILGNSKDPTYISKHLRKMFTALATFTLEKPGDVAASNQLRGFASLEGEEVSFKFPVEFRQRAMHEWLHEAEDGMVVALRESTLQAYNQLLSKNKVSLEWLDSFPSQVICLATQMWWVQQQEALFTSDAVVTEPTGANAAVVASRRSGTIGPTGSPNTSMLTNSSMQSSSSGPGADAVSQTTDAMDALLGTLASSVLDTSLSRFLRYKCEQIITVAVYQRDVSRNLAALNVSSVRDFEWVSVLRPYLANSPVPTTTVSGKRVFIVQQVIECRMADAALVHAFEYTGAYERLVQTPLTDKCYLTLMQALHTRLGGSPVGPAGTGKTETVKALGMQLGRHVLVFNCDDTFDYQAVSRIFLGLCQVGAWGCFDEFNRLEERIMSALSQQIQIIQESLRSRSIDIELNDHQVPLHDNVGIFITMNPGYAGRSNLPGNLKQLFRAVTMTIPDRETIAEVMLFAQGFVTAEKLSLKIVPLFRLCEEQFSRQAHYDFGLRALKSVLVAAGALKRKASLLLSQQQSQQGRSPMAKRRSSSSSPLATPARGARPATADAAAVEDEECDLILESLIANISPKLITQDQTLFYPLLTDFFPNHPLPTVPMRELREAIAEVCELSGLTAASEWVEKICQLYHTKETRHGVMIVGPSGTGKTTAWKTLMAAMVRVDRTLEMRAYVIDPKVLSKAELFGSLDITTREWKDGVFTSILRKVLETEQNTLEREAAAAQRRAGGGAGPSEPEDSVKRRYWIIFDGDVDPEWVENLNSVLDDNKILTLPNGERLPLPRSMRIFFEAQDLRFATPATVSRCGMLWFSEGVVSFSSVLGYARHRLERKPVCDVRGRRVRWNLEEDMLGVISSSSGFGSAANAAASFTGSYSAGSPPTAVGHRGKTYSEYVITSTPAGMELMSGGSRWLTGPDDNDAAAGAGEWSGNPSTRSANAAPRGSPGPQDTGYTMGSSMAASLGGTVAGGGGGAVAPRDTHPDAFRVKQAMMAVWGPAFGPQGLILKGVQLMVNSAKYHGATIMEFNVLEVLESILALLLDGVWRAFKTEQESGNTLPDSVLSSIAQKTLHHAVFWGLGASMNYENRKSLEHDLGFAPKVDNVAHTMLDVEVDYLTGSWKCVRDRVGQREILAEQVGANDTVIPTVDTSRHEDLLQAWLGSGRSAILCGPPGSGKTMSVTAVLNSSPLYEAVFLNFSSGTTVDTVLKALEQYCSVQNTAHGYVMAPVSGKKLLLFCDEINLPALNRYGTQVVLQLLRQLIERRGFYRPRDNVWVEIADIQVVGACNPPTDPGRVPLSARFLRWAPVLLVDFPSPESLTIIYRTYCRAILSFNKRLCNDCAANLADAMVGMYRQSQAHFTPIQQPHYLYSPRELSRWSRAIYEGFQTLDDTDRKGLTTATTVRLAVHEGLRVFADRLVTQEEREWTDFTIDDCFKASFPNLSPTVLARPILYSTLLSRAYRDSPREELRQMLQKKLPAFCEEEVSAPLVVFDSVVDHVVRIHRVLRQPLGHVLIAGSSGVGKTIIARLVAWLGGFSPFWLKVHRDYDLEDFEEDLRSLLRRSGCKRERICFIFDESNIMQPAFLEYMNALLASGEVPGLFEGEEWPKLMQDIKEAIAAGHAQQSGGHRKRGGAGAGGAAGAAPPVASGGASGAAAGGIGSAAAAAAGTASGANKLTSSPAPAGATEAAAAANYLDMSSDQSLYRWFLQNVKEQLHVVFTINPSSSEFSTRTVASPALFNRCTVDWFGDWDQDTLVQITRERTKDLKLLSTCGNVFKSEEDAHRAVVQTLCEIHQSTREVNLALRSRNANQGTHITPRHFSDLVGHFVQLLNEKSTSSTEQLQHLRSGLGKLDDTSREVATQKVTLQENEKRMAEKSARSQTMLERIIAETDTTQREKAAAEQLRQQLQMEQDSIDKDAKQMKVDLAEAEPALKSAEMALSTVKPEYLREIRAYTTPPPMVKRVLEATCAIMGERNSEDWDVLKNLIRREDFLASVKAFKPDDITEAAKERVSAMMKDPKFTVEAAYRASKAAGPLLQWVFAQVQFSGIYKRVAPMREKIMYLIETREAKVKGLVKTEKEIKEKEDSLQQLKTDYQTTTQEMNDLKQKTQVVSAKCERASTILGQLLDEHKRWEEEIGNFDKEARTTLGDCIVSAAFLSYIGYYDEFTRQQVLLPRWAEYLGLSTIPVRAHLSVMDYLVSPNKRLEWEENGLPKDRLCLEDVTIMDRCNRYTLLVDPAGTAARFLQKFYAKQKITKASFSRPGYLKQLEMAVRFGYPIVLEDAELLDPAVAPLLNSEIRMAGGHYITRIGANDVDMSSTFKLFLLTRDPHYQPAPDLAGQVCVVNFTVTLSSLQSQCLHQILLHERPDIDKRRTELLSTQGEYRLKLRVLEQNLLTSIAESEGSLLDNDALISSLAELKTEACRIQLDISSSETSMQVIEQVESHYQPVAAVASRVFFSLKRFSELSSFYRFDVQFLFRALQDALGALPKRASPTPTSAAAPGSGEAPGGVSTGGLAAEELARAHVLTNCLFTLVHHRIVRGTFKEDHLVLALRLAQLRSSADPDSGPADDRSTPLARLPGSASASKKISEDEWDWMLDGVRSTVGQGSRSPSTRKPTAAAVEGAAGAAAPALPPVLLRPGVLAVGKHGRVALSKLLEKHAFRELRASLTSQASAWEALLLSATPADGILSLPESCFPVGSSSVRKLFLAALLLFYTRRDSFTSAVWHLLAMFFDGDAADGSPAATMPSVVAEPSSLPAELTADLAGRRAVGGFFAQTTHMVRKLLPELTNATPLVLVGDVGYDPSSRVEQVADEVKATLHVVAMGSAESTQYADQYLNEGLAKGTWVLLKNIHLAREYLNTVEKRLHFDLLEGKVHAGFRLLLTVERGPREDPRDLESRRAGRANVVPINLLESAVKIVFEAPPGLKSSLLQTYGSLEQRTVNAAASPVAAAAPDASKQRLAPAATLGMPSNTQLERLYLAVGWLHAVIMERLAYVPMGWSYSYEFSDTEYIRAVQAVTAWTTTRKATGEPTSAGELPVVMWPALRRMVASTVYGGKVSNPFDQHLFHLLCDQVLSQAVFNKDFVFVRPPASVKKHFTSFPPPIDGFKSSRSELLKWISRLPDGSSNPQWLGLPSNVARMLLARQAYESVERLAAVQTVLNEELASLSAAPAATASLSAQTSSSTAGSLTPNRRNASSSTAPSMLLAGSLDRVGMASARWAEKVREYCGAWQPGLQGILAKLEKSSFVAKALSAVDDARSTELISGVGQRVDSGDKSSASAAAAAATVAAPLELAVQRECVALVRLLRRLVADLRELSEVCSSARKPSSAHRELMESLTKDRVPSAWSAFLHRNTTTCTAAVLLVSGWIADVQQRAEHLLTLAAATLARTLPTTCVSLGLLCFPGAFLTAAKQQCARELRAPLDQLSAQLEVVPEAALRTKPAAASGAATTAGALLLSGLTLFAAQTNAQGLAELIHASSAVAPLSTPTAARWSWVRSVKKGSTLQQQGSLAARLAAQRPFQSTVVIPFYVTEQRDALLEVVQLPIVANGELDCWYERGVCLCAWVPSE